MAAQTASQTDINKQASAKRWGFRSGGLRVNATAAVHEFSLVEGEVDIGAGAIIAPGTAVTAAPGASVVVGDRVYLLPGVIAEASVGPQVSGADGAPCSIWIGEGSAIAHKSLIHSPVYLGKNCFVGFRSTIYNARLGDGCVVMMHALVQDVEVPPGRCVPSGSIITSQHQADQLPNVRPEDLALVREAVGLLPGASNRSSPSAYSSQSSHASKAKLVAIRGGTARRANPRGSRSGKQSSHTYQSTAHTGTTMQTQLLSPEIVQQVRSHLSQGYRIGMEHADKRHYQSGVWETCPPIKDRGEQSVLAGLERCISEHEGEYVRMFGIDPKAKRRVGMTTIRRPGDKRNSSKAASPSGAYGSDRQSTQSGYDTHRNGRSSNGSSAGQGGLNPGIVQEARNLLSSGYIIGTEHAGPRHYRSNVWKVCSPIETTNEREVFAKLEHCLEEHSGEYVRMFGIDRSANSRTATTTIQRADGKPVEVSSREVPQASYTSPSSSGRSGGGYSSSDRHQSSGNASDEVVQAVHQILRSGNQIGIEYADKRRYRSGIWQTAPTISSGGESRALSKLQQFLSQNEDKYVRVFGVNPGQKTRGSSITIQKPGQKQKNSQSSKGESESQRGSSGSRPDPINENPPHYDDPAFLNRSGNQGGLDSDVTDQISRLVGQGHKISIEYADKRRYRSGIWKTGPAINARRPADAITALNSQLTQHKGEYVRLIATDADAKRRVAEITVQRPGQGSSGKTGSGKNSSGKTGYRKSSRSRDRRDPINANPPHYDDPAFRGQPSSYNSSGYSARRGGVSDDGSNSGLESEVLDQVTQLVNQGHKISVEYADKRRYRSGIWKTGEAIDARRPAEAISALGKQLARHEGEYVRLVGTDTQAKRRVLEATIQRP